VLIGAVGAAVSAGWSAVNRPTTASGRTAGRDTAILAFTVVFPLVCQVVGHGRSFTGMRHFLFVVPPIATLAGIGIDACLSALQARALAAGIAALATVATAFALDAATQARLRPYEHLFKNSLVGGLAGASRNYETDYWVNIAPEAVKDLERYIAATNIRARANTPPGYLVGVCGERVAFENEAKSSLQWTGDWSHADFFIAPTHMNCDEVLRGMTVSVIERLGVPIGVVKDLRGISPQARWCDTGGPMPVRPAPAAFLPQTPGRERWYGEHSCGVPEINLPREVVLNACAFRADMIVLGYPGIVASLYDAVDWALTGHVLRIEKPCGRALCVGELPASGSASVTVDVPALSVEHGAMPATLEAYAQSGFYGR
jgi:hypothetical protein